MMGISRRLAGMPASPIRKLQPYAVDAEAEGRHIYHLNIGQPDIKTPDAVLDAIKNIKLDVLSYGPSAGLVEYRDKLLEYYSRYNISLERDDILVTTAGSEAVRYAMFAACDPGNEIIIPEPYYSNYNGFAVINNVNLVPITCSIESGFALPEMKAFEEKITGKTRAIMICNPNNPTGAVYSRESIEELLELARKYDICLISDEVYREFVYDGPVHTSILEFPEFADNVIVIDSISKRYSACGARIGALICRNRDITGGVLKMAQARLCPPTIEQIAAAAAVDIGEEYFIEMRKEYKKRRDIVFNALNNMPGVVCRKPAGAFYIVASLPVLDAEEFVVFLLKDFAIEGKTVMVAPAEGFYRTPGLGRSQVRLAYVLNEEELADAMSIFSRGLEEFQKQRVSLV